MLFLKYASSFYIVKIRRWMTLGNRFNILIELNVLKEISVVQLVVNGDVLRRKRKGVHNELLLVIYSGLTRTTRTRRGEGVLDALNSVS